MVQWNASRGKSENFNRIASVNLTIDNRETITWIYETSTTSSSELQQQQENCGVEKKVAESPLIMIKWTDDFQFYHQSN